MSVGGGEERAGDGERVPWSAADVVQTMPVGYLSWNEAWQCVAVNAEGERLTGKAAEQMLGRTYWDLFPDMAGTDLEEAYLRVAVSGHPETVEVFYPPLGAWFDTRVVRGPLGVSAFFSDATGRHDTQNELAHTLEHSQAETAALAEALTAKDLADAQLARLVEVAMALTAARSIEELEQIVVGRGLAVLGADGGAITSPDNTGGWRITASASLGERVQMIYGQVPHDSPLPGPWTARTGKRLLLPTRAAGVQFHPDMAEVYRSTGRNGWAFLPLTVAGDQLGCLAVCWAEEHTPTESELVVLDGFAAQCAQTLQRIRTMQAERAAAEQMSKMAEALQHALLTAPPEPDHVHVVVRYRPAADVADVGGDWYDAFMQPGGATMLTIGDVVGHDQIAAAQMGQLRGLIRALAYDAGDSGRPDTPSAILTRVEHAARGLAVNTLASTILARVERLPDAPGGARVLRWTNAGHPYPALLLADGTVRFLDERPDVILGVDPNVPRRDHATELPEGSTLVLYTDGLIERRDSSLDDGMAALAKALTDLAGLPADELCDELLRRLAPIGGEDDIALLAVRFYPEDGARPAEAGPAEVPGR